MTGKQILNYRIESLICEDDLGILYLATHIPSNQQVNIRLLNHHLADSLFLSEQLQSVSEQLTALDHPCISKVYSVVAQTEGLYMISEYIQGISLSECISSPAKPLYEEDIWDISMQLVEAFGYAHAKGVTHLSIHPDHIIITASNQVKVTGFGVTALLTNAGSKRLQNGIALREVQYVSPEYLLGKPLTAQSDIYSLGVILFALLTKADPYPSVLSVKDIQKKIINDSLPPIKLYTQAFAHSYTMQAIIDKATAKSVVFRFQSCSELADSLLEEKDERESIGIAQLLDEVNNKHNPGISRKKRLTVSAVKQKLQTKTAAQMLIATGLIVSTIFIGVRIYKINPAKASIAANKINDMFTVSQSAGEKMPPAVTGEREDSANQLAGKMKDLLSKSKTKAENNTTVQAGMSVGTGAKSVAFSKTHLQNRLSHFYEALQSKDIKQIEGQYAPLLTRFYDEYNVTETQLRQKLENAWQKTHADQYDILWNTFQYYQDQQGNYVIDFFMNYRYRPANEDHFSTKEIYTIIKMDSMLQISYISSQ